MAQPTPYLRLTNFRNEQALAPTTPIDATKADQEWDNIKLTLDQLLANLKKIQSDDGALARGSVSFDQLAGDVQLGIQEPSNWAPATDYLINNTVLQGNKLYQAQENHTSSADFNTDLNAVPSKWLQLLDFGADTTAAQAAAAQTTADLAAVTAAAAQVTTLTGQAVIAKDLAEAAAASANNVQDWSTFADQYNAQAPTKATLVGFTGAQAIEPIYYAGEWRYISPADPTVNLPLRFGASHSEQIERFNAEDNVFIIDIASDRVLRRDALVPANNFVGSISEAVATIGLVETAAGRYEIPVANLPIGPADGYTIFASAGPTADVANISEYLLSLDNATGTNAMSLRNATAGNAGVFARVFDVTAQVGISSANNVAATTFQAAFTMTSNDFRMVINGVAETPDTAGSVPSGLTTFNVGQNHVQSQPWTTPLIYGAMIPRVMSDADMIAVHQA